MCAAFGPLLLCRMSGGLLSYYVLAAMALVFFLTLLFYYSDYKPEGNPLERLVPFIVSMVIVQLGRRKQKQG